jgi:hypothetical protein
MKCHLKTVCFVSKNNSNIFIDKISFNNNGVTNDDKNALKISINTTITHFIINVNNY